MGIYDYLIAVAASKPVNAPRLRQLLQSAGVDFQDLGTATMTSKNKYAVTIKNHELFSQLIKQFKPALSRQEASDQGDSHRCGTSASYLVAKRHYADDAVFAICCKLDQYHSELEVSHFKSIIIIENSECFTHSQSFLDGLFDRETLAESIIVWGAGKSVLHKHSLAFLAQFERIFCCFDYDLVGLEMYESIRKHSDRCVSFVSPPEPWFEKPVNISHFKKVPRSELELKQAIKKASQLGFATLEQNFHRTGRFMEQEQLIGQRYE